MASRVKPQENVPKNISSALKARDNSAFPVGDEVTRLKHLLPLSPCEPASARDIITSGCSSIIVSGLRINEQADIHFTVGGDCAGLLSLFCTHRFSRPRYLFPGFHFSSNHGVLLF
jgi:hypothetical protein